MTLLHNIKIGKPQPDRLLILALHLKETQNNFSFSWLGSFLYLIISSNNMFFHFSLLLFNLNLLDNFLLGRLEPLLSSLLGLLLLDTFQAVVAIEGLGSDQLVADQLPHTLLTLLHNLLHRHELVIFKDTLALTSRPSGVKLGADLLALTVELSSLPSSCRSSRSPPRLRQTNPTPACPPLHS